MVFLVFFLSFLLSPNTVLYFFFLLIINFCLCIFVICLLRHGLPRLAFASCGHAVSVTRIRKIIIKCSKCSVVVLCLARALHQAFPHQIALFADSLLSHVAQI